MYLSPIDPIVIDDIPNSMITVSDNLKEVIRGNMFNNQIILNTSVKLFR